MDTNEPQLPLPPDDATINALHEWWSACNYLAGGMIYLRDNALLERPLEPADIKERLLGHWGASPGLSFVYTHLNRLIRERDVNAVFLAGPGHGAPGVLGPVYLEGHYGEIYPDRGEGREGMLALFRAFSFPGGIGSHCTPETPGSLHEGGELGYSLSHAFGTAFDHPDLLVTVVVGDGEAETGPLATAWHSNKFLNPARDGAVLPVLQLNGYKINNPTVLARIPHDELQALFSGYGWEPLFVEGSEPQAMHRRMAQVLDYAHDRIRQIQQAARQGGSAGPRPRWPMIIVRSPKGWTGPKTLDGHQIEGSWRAHQVPVAGVREHPARLALVEQWLRSYKPEERFDADGRLREDLRALAPQGTRRMSANPIANGGLVRRPLRLPDWRAYAVHIAAPGLQSAGNTAPLGAMLRDVLRDNPDNFRVFGPDETTSNKLDACYEVSGKTWLGERLPVDDDGGHLAADGRVMEYLSEHTLEGWLEGYLLSGRHGFLSTYEAFVHVIDSMFNQHAKWLATARHIPWRAPVSSLNLLITSTVWRQDHNGFTHQDPGFLDLVVNKSPEVTRIYLPPDANTLLAVGARCLASTNLINVIVCDKQSHLQYLSPEAAAHHVERGIGIWDWASNDEGEPDVVVAGCGDTATREALAAVQLLRRAFPDLRIRFVNVVDLYTLVPNSEHPHGLPDKEFDALFTPDKPVIFNFHGYPWLIHRLAYRRHNHANFHVRGYKEHGNINTPVELAIANEVDRFSLAIDAVERVPGLAVKGASFVQQWRDRQQDCRTYAWEHGTDDAAVRDWVWEG